MGKIKVLIADDNPDFAMTLVNYLEKDELIRVMNEILFFKEEPFEKGSSARLLMVLQICVYYCF